MKKCLLSLLAASIMAVTAMPIFANAEDDVTIANEKPYWWGEGAGMEAYKDCIEIKETELFKGFITAPQNKLFLGIGTNREYELSVVRPEPDNILFDIAAGRSINEVSDALSGLVSENGDTYTVKYLSSVPDSEGLVYEISCTNDIKVKDARNIKNILIEKGLIDDMVFQFERHYVTTYRSTALICGAVKLNEVDDFKSYAEQFTDWDINLRYERIKGKENDIKYYEFIPHKDVSLETQLEIAEKVYKDIGMRADFIAFMSNGDKVSTGINLFNSIDGDANCDNEVNMGDAVLIMQSLANPDKYSITTQGKFNADTNCDGITNADALAIQKYKLSLIPSLPETK